MNKKSNNVVLRSENVSKTFILPHDQHNGIKQIITSGFNRKKSYEVQKALDNVSFEVEKGDFIGIVGRNGSGKSTLLKVISGIYKPDKGRVHLNGSLVPFIELGVGFNPELTGRENVFLNAALLGFTHKQTEIIYDEIVSFAELDKFMDQKLKNYSSGMQVRLAFSIAIRAKSDILVLDEVLAVGDESFQRKCNDYFNELRKDPNRTVILVTHSMDAVTKYCNKAILINDGKIELKGSPYDVANKYTLLNSYQDDKHKVKDNEPDYNRDVIQKIKVRLLSDYVIDEKDEIVFMLEYEVLKNINTIPALSLVDIDRKIWIQNDNMWNNIVTGKGKHTIKYSCYLPKYVNDCILQIQVSVWDEKETRLGFINEEDSPKIIIRRKDINTKYEEGISSGILNMKGEWKKIDE